MAVNLHMIILDIVHQDMVHKIMVDKVIQELVHMLMKLIRLMIEILNLLRMKGEKD
jgi:hypothetical protein